MVRPESGGVCVRGYVSRKASDVLSSWQMAIMVVAGALGFVWREPALLYYCLLFPVAALVSNAMAKGDLRMFIRMCFDKAIAETEQAVGCRLGGRR